MGAELEIDACLKWARCIPNARAHRVKKGSNPGGEIHRYANLARRFQITGSKVRPVAERLGHLQNPFFCDCVYSAAAVDGAIHGTYGDSQGSSYVLDANGSAIPRTPLDGESLVCPLRRQFWNAFWPSSH